MVFIFPDKQFIKTTHVVNLAVSYNLERAQRFRGFGPNPYFMSTRFLMNHSFLKFNANYKPLSSTAKSSNRDSLSNQLNIDEREIIENIVSWFKFNIDAFDEQNFQVLLKTFNIYAERYVKNKMFYKKALETLSIEQIVKLFLVFETIQPFYFKLWHSPINLTVNESNIKACLEDLIIMTGVKALTYLPTSIYLSSRQKNDVYENIVNAYLNLSLTCPLDSSCSKKLQDCLKQVAFINTQLLKRVLSNYEPSLIKSKNHSRLFLDYVFYAMYPTNPFFILENLMTFVEKQIFAFQLSGDLTEQVEKMQQRLENHFF